MDLIEPENPRALVSLVTPDLREKILKLPENLINRSEHEIIIENQKTTPGWLPSEIDFGIRMSFWDEYNWAQKHNMQMRIASIYNGVCSDNAFCVITNTQHRLAYVITPFFNDVQKRRRALSVLWKEVMETIARPVAIDPKTGRPDNTLIAIKMDMFKFLHIAEHGEGVKHIKQETKNMNYNVDATAPPPQDMAQIDARIAELRAKELAINSQEITIALPVTKVISESGKIAPEHDEFKR